MGFKGGESVRSVNGGSAESSWPDGGEVGRWSKELDDRRGSEREGRCVDGTKFRQIQWCQVVNDLESEELNLKICPGFDGEPVELMQGRSDVFSRGSSGVGTGSCVLDLLEFMKISQRKTREERITVVQTGCTQGVCKDSVESVECCQTGSGTSEEDLSFVAVELEPWFSFLSAAGWSCGWQSGKTELDIFSIEYDISWECDQEAEDK